MNSRTINIVLAAVTVMSLGGVGCSEIKIGGSEIQHSVPPPPPPPPPAWKPPTMTQAQCDAIFRAPGGWAVTDDNKNKYFICAVYNRLNEDLVLAPEMRFFKESGVGVFGAMGVDIFYRTENGVALGVGGVDLISTGLSYIETERTRMQGQITYRQISGSSNILAPIQSGVFYKINTPAAEEVFEYQMQAENSFGVSPVKTIRITVRKAGIDPVAQPSCPGFSNTVFIDLDQYYGGRLLSKHYGQFGPNSILVIKLSLTTSGITRISALGNGWTFSEKSGNMSTRPCDLTTNRETFYNNENFNDMPRFGSAVEYSNDIVNTKRTFYLNIQNLNTAGGCGPAGFIDCAQYVEYMRIRAPRAELGNTVYYRKDWGYADCQGGGGKSTRTLTWSAVNNGYEETYCEQGQYIDPYYVR